MKRLKEQKTEEEEKEGDERMVQKGAKCLKLGYVQLYNESSVSGKHTMP